jgi:hypothetical protein
MKNNYPLLNDVDSMEQEDKYSINQIVRRYLHSIILGSGVKIKLNQTQGFMKKVFLFRFPHETDLFDGLFASRSKIENSSILDFNEVFQKWKEIEGIETINTYILEVGKKVYPLLSINVHNLSLFQTPNCNEGKTVFETKVIKPPKTILINSGFKQWNVCHKVEEIHHLKIKFPEYSAISKQSSLFDILIDFSCSDSKPARKKLHSIILSSGIQISLNHTQRFMKEIFLLRFPTGNNLIVELFGSSNQIKKLNTITLYKGFIKWIEMEGIKTVQKYIQRNYSKYQTAN